MSTNRVEQGAQNVVENMLRAHDRALRELKSRRQPIGADILAVQRIPEAGYAYGSSGSIAPGASVTFTALFTPASSILTLWNVLHSVYVDVNDDVHSWPLGASLSAGQKNATVIAWLDWGDSNDITNERVFRLFIRNEDSASHVYHVKLRAYIPTLAGSTAG